MNGKPVLSRVARTILNLENHGFQEKHLCDGPSFSAGDACAFGCTFCFVPAAMHKLNHGLLREASVAAAQRLSHPDVVIRREDSLEVLKGQLLNRKGLPKFLDPFDRRVVYASPIVDVAGNMELLRETAEICNLILKYTHWDIRLLSKSSLLQKLIEQKLIPERHHHRLILGFSTGTLNDRLAASIETGTAKVSQRIKALHWLQDRGIRTFGMICPSLPHDDYALFSREICKAIRVDRCEHVWAEVINLRGESFVKTLTALSGAGFHEEAAKLSGVCGKGSSERWEQYARETFQAHTLHVPPGKLRFLQYVTKSSLEWWSQHRGQGAVLLGKAAQPSPPANLMSDRPVAGMCDEGLRQARNN